MAVGMCPAAGGHPVRWPVRAGGKVSDFECAEHGVRIRGRKRGERIDRQRPAGGVRFVDWRAGR